MKEITKEVLQDAANRLMFTLTEEETNTLLAEFQVLKTQMETIGELDNLDSYAPMTFPFNVTTSWLREDVAVEPLTRDEALANAGSVQDGEIKLPKVVL